MGVIERARALRPIIERAMKEQDDKTVSEVAELLPKLKFGGELVKAGTRINWGGEVKKAAVDLWDTEENSPESAPTLWESIGYIDGIRVIPEVITVTAAFSKDERGWWKGSVYKSLVDNNVYTPEEYPGNWEEEA